jgi:NADPH:quinone reductase-like Zn-dependent oxidoreductase
MIYWNYSIDDADDLCGSEYKRKMASQGDVTLISTADATMTALTFAKYGKPAIGQLSLRTDVPRPVPAAGEVLIRVKAASLNPIDKIRVEGITKVFFSDAAAFKAGKAIIGCDVAGIVEEDAAGKFLKGDEVFARINRGDGTNGTIAQWSCAAVDVVAKKPPSLSFEQAASLPLVAETALQALRRGGVGEGSKVFITGGAGGVGTVAIQLAKILGAATVATTASAGEKTAKVKSLGADIVVDYKTQDFGDGSFGKDFDFAFDTTTESAKLAAVIRPGGKIVTIVGSPTAKELARIGVPLNCIKRLILHAIRDKAAVKNAKRAGAEWSNLWLVPSGSDLEELSRYVEEGKLQPVVDGVWPLAEWRAAVERSFSGRALGKCVIRVEE